MKILANGETVKLYLDDVFGVEIPFAATSGISFGFGTYCDEAGNVAIGYFDNALVKEVHPLWLKGISTATRCRMATSSSNIPAH